MAESPTARRGALSIVPPIEIDETTASTALVVPVRAVCIGRDCPQQQALKVALQGRGISTYLVQPDTSNVFSILERDPRVSVLGVRAAELGRSQCDEFLRRVFEQPGLATFVIGASGELEQELRLLGVTQLYANVFDPKTVADAVAASLEGHDFDSLIAESLGGALVDSLADAELQLAVREPFLRVGAGVLGQLSAITVIGGDDISGRVVVAGPQVFFERVARGWLGKKPTRKDMIWDAAGELCNRVTGLVRRHYADRGLQSRQATPTIIDGSDAAIRGMTAKPGLVVPCEVAKLADAIYLELVLASKAEDREPDVVPTTLEAGELTFL